MPKFCSAHKDVSVSPLALRAPRSLLSPAWELSYIGSAGWPWCLQFSCLSFGRRQVLAALLAVGHLVPAAGMGRLACKARVMGWSSMMTRNISLPVFQESFQLLLQVGASLAMSQTFPVAQAPAVGRD